MSDKYTAEELLLAERVLSRAEKLADPTQEQRRLGLRPDESNEELTNWRRDNSIYICLDRVIDQLHLAAKAVREKSGG